MWVALLGGLGCSSPPAQADPVSPDPAEGATSERESEEGTRAATPPPDPILEAWLRGCAVDDERFAFPKLYTWTRPDQIDELRDEPPRLLSRERARSGTLSRFDQELVDDDHPIARHLRSAGHRTRRFAWVTPWATRMGWQGAGYGNRLLEVRLREDAWFARFDASLDVGARGRWRVVDQRGEGQEDAQVMAHPDRIAAVYHLARGSRHYREFVLVDEAQIERFAYATEAIRSRCRDDAAQLRALAERWSIASPPVPDRVERWLAAGWNAPPDERSSSSLVSPYRSCLALGDEAYLPTPERLRAIAAAVDPLPDDEPIDLALPERPAPRRRARQRSRPVRGNPSDPTL